MLPHCKRTKPHGFRLIPNQNRLLLVGPHFDPAVVQKDKLRKVQMKPGRCEIALIINAFHLWHSNLCQNVPVTAVLHRHYSKVQVLCVRPPQHVEIVNVRWFGAAPHPPPLAVFFIVNRLTHTHIWSHILTNRLWWDAPPLL